MCRRVTTVFLLFLEMERPQKLRTRRGGGADSGSWDANDLSADGEGERPGIRGISRDPPTPEPAPAPLPRLTGLAPRVPRPPQLRGDSLAKGGAGRGPCEVLADSNRGNTGSGPQACPEVELRPQKSEVPVHKRVRSWVRSGGVSRPELAIRSRPPGTQSRPRSPASRQGRARGRRRRGEIQAHRPHPSQSGHKTATFVLCATQGG